MFTPITTARPRPRPQLVAVILGLILSAALAQPALPENAAQAIERGRQYMQEALGTYDAQYPDRPLWQQAFREGRTAVQLAPGHPEPCASWRRPTAAPTGPALPSAPGTSSLTPAGSSTPN